jgi:Flp pilus assembly protein TadG
MRWHRESRGQSITELALVFPILMLLLVAAIDFGRIYLGSVNLQNMTRIAANFAALNPDAWDATTPDPVAQQGYYDLVVADAAANNCELPKDGAGKDVVPHPRLSLPRETSVSP